MVAWASNPGSACAMCIPHWNEVCWHWWLQHTLQSVTLLLSLRRPALAPQVENSINLLTLHTVDVAPVKEVETPCEGFFHVGLFATGSKVGDNNSKREVSWQARAAAFPAYLRELRTLSRRSEWSCSLVVVHQLTVQNVQKLMAPLLPSPSPSRARGVRLSQLRVTVIKFCPEKKKIEIHSTESKGMVIGDHSGMTKLTVQADLHVVRWGGHYERGDKLLAAGQSSRQTFRRRQGKWIFS